jgi:CHAT domain-containing protein/Tfp pilus assembly protein PilF
VLADAQKIYEEQGAKAALPKYEQALALYRAAHNRRSEAITLGLIGNCYKQLGDSSRALTLLSQALAMKREIGDRLEEGKTLSHIGLLYWRLGDNAKANDFLNRSVAIASAVGDRRLEGADLNNLGLVADEQGEYTRSREYYQHALELHRASGFARGETDVLGNIGGWHLLLGRYVEAAEYYRQALVLDERLGFKPRAIIDLTNLAACQLATGDTNEAIATYERARKLAEDAGLKKEQADCRRGKGAALARLGKIDQAFAEYRASVDTYESADLKPQLIEVLNDRGLLEATVGDDVSAERDFRRAIDLSQTEGHPRGVTENLIALGTLEWRRQRFGEASKLFADARNRARQSGDKSLLAAAALQLATAERSQQQLDSALRDAREGYAVAHEIGAQPLEAEGLLLLGVLASARGDYREAIARFDEGDRAARESAATDVSWRLSFERGRTFEAQQKDDDAVDAYRRAVATIEQVRDELSEHRYRSGYLEDKQQVYSALVRLLVNRRRSDEAFQFAERLRARSYLESLAAAPLSSPDPAERRRETALRSRIQLLRQELEDETMKSRSDRHEQAVTVFSSELSDAERAYTALLDDLRRSQPEAAAQRNLRMVSASDVQPLIGEGTALVEYVTGQESIEVFVLTRTSLHATTIPMTADALNAKVELLRDLVVQEGTADWRKPARSLYGTLFSGLEQSGWLRGVDRLYIVPHGVLHYLPFSVLVASETPSVRCLVDTYTIAYLPAAAALITKPARPLRDDPVLAMAPARPRLPFAQQEAAIAARGLGGPSLLLVGEQATKSQFKQQASHYRLLHLATHGFFNKMNPLFSGIEFEPDADEDGTLNAYEIQAMRLDADLVALSACDTALGGGLMSDTPPGEDFVGLIRAFLSAGSRSVLATLWHVNDRSTLDLMQEFYQRLPAGDGASALADAQRALKGRGGRYEHPYFWAAFVLEGASQGPNPTVRKTPAAIRVSR